MNKKSHKPSRATHSKNSRLLKFLGSSKLSIAAVLIVAGIAGYGAYQFVNSGALSNYAALKDACRAQNPQSNDKPTNNNQKKRQDCIQAVDDLKVTEEAQELSQRCAENKRHVVNNQYCGNCYDAYVDVQGDPNNGACERRATCTGAHQFYKPADNSCGCESGWFMQDGNCKPLNNPAPAPTPGTTTPPDGKPAVKARCASNYREYKANSEDGYCGPCLDGYKDGGGTGGQGQCVPKTSSSTPTASSGGTATTTSVACSSTNMVLVGDACEKSKQSSCAVNEQYDAATNNCVDKNGSSQEASATERQKASQDCVKDFIKDRGKCVPTKTLDSKEIKDLCAKTHLQYDSRSNNCSSSCSQGFVIGDNNKCITPDKLKNACSALNLQFNDATNKCTAKCVEGYKKSADGTCVDKASSPDGMSERVCRVLGRSWVDTPPKTATCTKKCLDTKSIYVAGASDLVSFCKGSSLGVNPGMSEPNCQALNRIYLDSLTACSARCRGGFFLKDGLCKQIAITINPSDTTDDACAVALQTETVTDENGVESEEQYCPEPVVCAAALITKTTYSDDDGYQTEDGHCPDEDSCLVALVNDNLKLADRSTLQRVNFCSDEDDPGCSVDLQVKTIANEDGTTTVINNYCADDEAPLDPPVEGLSAGAADIQDVDQLIDEETCELLGRVWVPGYNNGETTIAGGCSTQECLFEGANMQSADETLYCEGNVERISEDACDEANRQWLDEVEGCAELLSDFDFSDFDESDYAEFGFDDMLYSEDDIYFGEASETDTDSYLTGEDSDPMSLATEPILNASACKAPTTTYVHRTPKNGGDHCRRPTVVERLKSVTSGAGKALGGVTSIPGRLICNAQPGKVWQDGCVTQNLPNAKQGGDARRKDSFGNVFNVNTISNKRTTCAKLSGSVNEAGQKKFNCLPRSECKLAGGFYKIAYLHMADTNKVQSARVCWGVSS